MNNSIKRILFVIPPYFNIDDFLNKHRSNVIPAFTVPYGVLSLDAYLKKECMNKVETSILDLNIFLKAIADTEGSGVDCLRMFSTQVLLYIKTFQPDIVGISALFNSSFRYMEQLAETVKKSGSAAIVVAGGGLPSAASHKMLDSCPSIDAVCKGEGEIPLKVLMNASNASNVWTVLDNHASWLTRKGVQAGKIPSHTFVKDLDEVPVLNYELVDLNNYNSRSIDKRYIGQPKREMAIHTSRGCPFQCVFCSNPSLHGREVRIMSIDKVVAEVQRMKDQFGLTVLMIEDDHFFHDVARAKEILRRVIELKIRIEFPNGVAVYAIDEEVASLFRQAGVSTVALAVESGSDYVLNHIIKKPLRKKLIRPAVEALRRHGVLSHVFIVIGLPGEMPEHRQETIDMMIDVGFDWSHIYCAIPIFGSRLYDICANNGYIENPNQLDFINTKSVIRAPGVDPDEIEKMAYQINLTVNFVNNHNIKLGNYDTAIKYFTNVCEKYPDHAFAHYFISRAYRLAGVELDKAVEHKILFSKIVADDPWWAEQAKNHNLEYEANTCLTC